MSGGKEKDIRLEAAAAWLTRLESDEATEADWLAFERWLAEPENNSAVEAIESKLAFVEDHKAELRDQLGPPAGKVLEFTQRPGKTRKRTSAWMVLAGGLAAAAAAFVFLIRAPAPAAVTESTYSASAIQTTQLKLADGSIVWLNRGSTIKVRYTDGERGVTLQNGEASFAVKHDPAKPFIVRTGDAVVTDLGTEFNVARDIEGVTVTVRSGSVSFAQGTARAVTVAAGQQVQATTQSAPTLTQVNPDDAFAWQQQRLVFHDARLADIVKRLNVYSNVPIKAAPQVEELRFSGVLVIGSPAEMVSQLQAFLPVQADTGKEEIVLRSR